MAMDSGRKKVEASYEGRYTVDEVLGLIYVIQYFIPKIPISAGFSVLLRQYQLTQQRKRNLLLKLFQFADVE